MLECRLLPAGSHRALESCPRVLVGNNRRRRNMRKQVLLTIGMLVLGIGASRCGGSSPSSPSTSGAITIAITGQNGNLSFNPNPADAGGKTVVFKNNDSITHHVQLNDGSGDTGDIAPGATSKAV